MSNDNSYRPFMPMMMLAAALAVWLGFTTVQLQQDRASLTDTQEQLAPKLEAANEVRQQLHGVAKELKALSDQGNPNATNIMAQLDAQGLTARILPSATATDASTTE